jgi:dTDP-4-amino-4,6-dideoxygalactose transaminase
MAQAGVLCPVHWHLPPEVDPRRFPEAVDLSSQILTLPIDQRYDVHDMQFVAEALARAIA